MYDVAVTHIANCLTNVATQEIGDKELLDKYHYICIVSDFILSSAYYEHSKTFH